MTTVQIREDTRRLLEKLKRQMGLGTYDEVIKSLARSKSGLPESLFGACKGSHRFVRESKSMTSSFVTDTYAWVEYLLGSKAGAKARSYIEGGVGLTPSVVLAELRKWYLREIEAGRRSEREMQSHLAYIESMTETVPLDAGLG